MTWFAGEPDAGALRQQLEALADALPALVAFVDADRVYRYVNGAYSAWFGRERAAFIGKRLDEVAGPEMYEQFRRHADLALAGTPQQFQSRVAYPTGERDVRVHYTPLRDPGGAVTGFAVLVYDIGHERIQRAAAQRLERLLEVAGQLATASSEDEVARAVVDAGVDAIGAALAGVWRVAAGGEALELVRSRGFLPGYAASFAVMPLDSARPVPEAARTGRPVWISSRAEYAARYPDVEAAHRRPGGGPLALGIAPILIDGEPRGALAFGFHDERRLTADERTYVEILAAHAGHALQRVGLHQQLVEALETGQAIIRSSPAAIVLLDADGTVQAWNPAAERMFGWRADEVIGRFLPTVPDGGRAVFLEQLAAVLAGRVITGFDTTRYTRDGRALDVTIHAAPVRRSTGTVSCLSMLVDASDRKRVERGRQLVAQAGDLLARSLDWERTIAQLVAIPVPGFADWCAVFLLEGDQLRCLAHTGGPDASPPSPLPHQPGVGTVSTAIATGRAQIMEDLDDAARRRVARSPEHLSELRALGMRSYLSVPMRAGSVVGALSFGSRTRNFDAFDTTVADGLATRAAGAIENARLYRDATEARAEAEAANRAKDEFLAVLGHELRNPLAPIATALELMSIRSPELSRERAVIQRQVGHLTRLVDDLLDVSRIARGRVELVRARITVASVVARAVELASPLLDQHHHSLAVDVPVDLEVDGDATRLAQVVTNLLTNAARYTPPGGRIEVGAHRDGGEVVLVVRDNGVGIGPDVLPRIFDMFVQGAQGLARTQGGLGLGLSIVKALVTAHAGSVTARSAGPGAGTAFEVRLPLAAGAPPAVASSRPPSAGRRGASRRVLVVDDNRDAAEGLGALLEAAGHEVRTAYDGPTALEVAATFAPEVGLLDLGLPVMDGYELAQRLRSDPRHAAMRLIAVTGYGHASARERSRSAGFDGHLAKPVLPEDLRRAVEE